MTSGFRSITQRGLLSAVLFLLLTYAAAADEWVVAEAGAFYPKRSPQLAITADGTPVIAYYDGKGGILVRRKGFDPKRLNDSPRAGKPSGLALAAAGGNLVAAWRERRKGEWTLVLRRSTDGGETWSDATLIGSATRPLTRIQLGGDSSNLYLLWSGVSPCS